MENTILNKQEFENFEKRGFFVKKNYQFIDLANSLGNIIIYTCLFIILSIFPLGFSMVIFLPIGENLTISGYITIFIIFLYLVIFGIFPILNFFYSFFTSGVSFFINNGIIEFGKINGNRFKSLFFINNIIKRIVVRGEGLYGGLAIGIFLTSMIAIFLIGSDLIPFVTNNGNNAFLNLFFIELIAFILLGVAISPLVILLLIGRYIFQSFHPLYAFGNIGEKIQSLTPRIEEQSKKIQSEFQSDMNYSVLSDGFDLLSATFSEIIALVIKLEKVEARANKGNLFDSEKYINSLRSDIITPLTSLKAFLEKQKTEVLKSQKELTRVRVGGSEGSENIELQSKRSESLVQELTENIEKLDVMIGKMGV